MVRTTPTGWTRALAALLMLVAAVAGAGRGFPDAFRPGLAASDLRAFGLIAPICHAGDGAGPAVRISPTSPDALASSGAPASPDAPPQGCCDACALLAPAVLPTAPGVPTRIAVALPAERGAVPTPARDLPRQRGPRLSRGPPRG